MATGAREAVDERQLNKNKHQTFDIVHGSLYSLGLVHICICVCLCVHKTAEPLDGVTTQSDTQT